MAHSRVRCPSVTYQLHKVVLVPVARDWGLLLDPTDLSLVYVCMCACEWDMRVRDLRSIVIVGLSLGKTKGANGINLCLTPHPCSRDRSHLGFW